MRATALIRAVAVVLLAGICYACDTSSEMSFGGDAQQVRNIADLKRLCTGTTHHIVQDIAIRGVITGNDLYREFSKTLIIQDASGGIPVLVDHTALADTYPFGIQVVIHCNGLALGESGGKIQLGAAPTGEYSVDRIPRAEVGRYIRPTGTIEPPQGVHLTFKEITAQHIGTYVHLNNIRFATADPWCDPNPETLRPEVCEREIVDTNGSIFSVRIPGECTYATEPAPFGTGSIGGIIDYFNGKYTLRITNHNLRFRAFEARPTACPSTAEYSSPSPRR